MTMAKVKHELSVDYNVENIQEIVDDVNQRYSDIENIVENVVKDYSKDLDDLVAEIKESLAHHQTLTDMELDMYIASIPLQLYYVSSAIEALSVKEDIIKAKRQLIYHLKREEAEGTIDDKNNYAESAVSQETLVRDIFIKASKKLKYKADMALELSTSLKKILSRRMEEYRNQ